MCKKSTINKLIAILLCLTLILQVIPMSVYATQDNRPLVFSKAAISAAFTQMVEDNPNEPQTVDDEVFIIGEDESRRDENTKHYILSNGNRKAVQYAKPVHYKKDGKWEDIDNSFSFNEETNQYTNKANSFKVKFNKNLKSEDLFSIENAGYTMSWRYKSSADRGATVSGEPQENKLHILNEFEKHTANVNSKIKYDNFENKSTLEYVVTATGVKENIILQSAECKKTGDGSLS